MVGQDGSVALRNLDDVDTLLAVVITCFNTTGSVSIELNFPIATEPLAARGTTSEG
jgi:hypothetical protein